MVARTKELEKDGLFPQMNIPYRLSCELGFDGPLTTKNLQCLDVALWL